MKLWEVKPNTVIQKRNSPDRKLYKIVGDKVLVQKEDGSWKPFKFNLFVNKTDFEEYKEPRKVKRFYAYPICKDNKECTLTFLSEDKQQALLNIPDEETALQYPTKIEPATHKLYIEIPE